MFFRSIRERICSALLMRLSVCCQELLPTANDAGEPKNVLDLERRAHDLARAAEAAADAGDWKVVPELETRRQEIDEELREARERWFAEREAQEFERVIGRPTLQGGPRSRLFATQARLNFAFAKLYMRLSANHGR